MSPPGAAVGRGPSQALRSPARSVRLFRSTGLVSVPYRLERCVTTPGPATIGSSATCWSERRCLNWRPNQAGRSVPMTMESGAGFAVVAGSVSRRLHPALALVPVVPFTPHAAGPRIVRSPKRVSTGHAEPIEHAGAVQARFVLIFVGLANAGATFERKPRWVRFSASRSRARHWYYKAAASGWPPKAIGDLSRRLD